MSSSGGRHVCRPFSRSLRDYYRNLNVVNHDFLKHIFYVPSLTPGPILLKMSGLNSVASEIAIKKLLLLGRLITEPNMAPTVRNLF